MTLFVMNNPGQMKMPPELRKPHMLKKRRKQTLPGSKEKEKEKPGRCTGKEKKNTCQKNMQSRIIRPDEAIVSEGHGSG